MFDITSEWLDGGLDITFRMGWEREREYLDEF